jgi:hypothetical protein
MTLACATRAEARAARRAGLHAALIGVGGANGIPEGPVVSYGVAGSLDGLSRGTILDVVRVVDERGGTVWEGKGLGVLGAVRGSVVAADRIVDDPGARASLHRASGADAVDLETGALARRGELHGALRVVADTPERPLGALTGAIRPDGSYDWAGLARALVRSPRAAVRAAVDAKRALNALEAATRRWAGG